MTQWSELFVKVLVDSGIAIFVGVAVPLLGVSVAVLHCLTSRHGSAVANSAGFGGRPLGSRCQLSRLSL